jgi:hypothetical protein
MNNLSRAIAYLWPTLDFADVDGTLEHVRYDDPLPRGFTPPTQADIDAAIAKINTPPTPAEKLAASGLTVDELKQLLGIV